MNERGGAYSDPEQGYTRCPHCPLHNLPCDVSHYSHPPIYHRHGGNDWCRWMTLPKGEP